MLGDRYKGLLTLIDNAGSIQGRKPVLRNPGNQALLEGKSGLEKHEALIQRLVEHDARFLELVATLHYFTKNGYSFGEAKEEIRKAKDEQGYTNTEFERARTFLNDLKDLLA